MKDRIFSSKDKDGNELVLKYVHPTQSVLSKAELVFRTAFSKAFRADIITNAEVEKMLTSRGIWTDEERAKATELRLKIADLESKLEAENVSLSNEQGLQVCNEITKLRIELLQLNSIYQTIVDNTCETIAEEAKNRFLTTECIVDNTTGLRVYKDVDDFQNRADEQLAWDCFREVVVAGLEARSGRSLPSDLTEDYAENKWKKERGIGRFEEVPEETAEEVDEVKEVKPKKKATRKKRAKKTS